MSWKKRFPSVAVIGRYPTSSYGKCIVMRRHPLEHCCFQGVLFFASHNKSLYDYCKHYHKEAAHMHKTLLGYMDLFVHNSQFVNSLISCLATIVPASMGERYSPSSSQTNVIEYCPIMNQMKSDPLSTPSISIRRMAYVISV